MKLCPPIIRFSSAMFEMQLFDAGLAKSRFSQCLGHRMVPKWSNFECFWQLALLNFMLVVHGDPPSICWSTQTKNCALQAAGGSLCTFCVKPSKASCQKYSKFDRFGTVRWPEHRDIRNLTRPAANSCKSLHLKDCRWKNKLLEDIVRWLGNILMCCVTNLEHGLRIASEDKTVDWIRLEDEFHSL